MNRMKGMLGICLRPDSVLIEAKIQIYNRTPLTQTFLWWANVGVHANNDYEAIFPPDVTFVADHAKRAYTDFPFAKAPYYGVDYSPGTDLRWYRNIPVPTSYMVTRSDYDFMGGYDHGKQAGFIHVADRRVAPGKKLWTWGNADFGRAWDRELTDTDGPYIELMSGVFTDNQPDFSWLHPYETRTASQFWYPIQQIGPVKNANTRAALSLDVVDGGVRIGIAVTEAGNDGLQIVLSRRELRSIRRAPIYARAIPSRRRSSSIARQRSMNSNSSSTTDRDANWSAIVASVLRRSRCLTRPSSRRSPAR